jgi:hypothetical protein
MKKQSGHVIYSPSDPIRYLASPFASWIDRYNLENPGKIKPDEETEEGTLLSRTDEAFHAAGHSCSRRRLSEMQSRFLSGALSALRCPFGA